MTGSTARAGASGRSVGRLSGRATIIDVAARAGVSRQTVTRAINDMPGISASTRAAVLEAADELHYRPSRFGRGLATQQPPTVALLVDDLANAFFPQLATAVVREAAALGWNVVVSETRSTERPEAFGRDLARRVDALVGYNLPSTPETAAALTAARTPMVHLGIDEHDPRPGVVLRDREAMLAVAAHLHGRRVSQVSVLEPPGPGGMVSDGTDDRVRRWLRALGDSGLSAAAVPATGAGLSGQVAAVIEDIRTPVVPGRRAVIAWNDTHALGVLKALRLHGLHVPEDLLVLGTDGLAIGTLVTPELTTIGTDFSRLARAAMDLVDGLYAGRIRPRTAQAQRRVDYELIVRESA